MIGLDAILGIGGKLIDKLCLQSLFWCFSSTQPKINCAVRQTSYFAPFSYWKFFPKGIDKPCVTSIFSLLFSGSPYAIFRGVTLIVINSFNTKFIWPFSHICQKIFKMHPSGTNRNSPSTVIFISLTSWASASFFNSFPYLIGRSAFSAQSVTV